MTSILTNPHVISNVSSVVMLLTPIYLSLRFKGWGYFLSIPLTWGIGIGAYDALMLAAPGDAHRLHYTQMIWAFVGIPVVFIYGDPFLLIRAVYDDYFAPKDAKAKNATSNDVKQPHETPE